MRVFERSGADADDEHAEETNHADQKEKDNLNVSAPRQAVLGLLGGVRLGLGWRASSRVSDTVSSSRQLLPA